LVFSGETLPWMSLPPLIDKLLKLIPTAEGASESARGDH
jgi:hypothetical protein